MLITPNWLDVCLNHISVFTLCFLLPLAAAVIWFSCRESWMFHLPSFISLLSLCLTNKALQIQPNSPTCPHRKCCERLHQLLLYSVNKIQPAATSGIFRSFHNHPTSTAARHKQRLTRGSPQQEPNSPFWRILLITGAAAVQNTLLSSDYLVMWGSWMPHTPTHVWY